MQATWFRFSNPQIPVLAGFLAVVGFLVLFLFGFISSLAVLTTYWTGEASAGYDHGFLVLLCSLYLLYDRRSEFKRQPLKPNLWALLPLAGASLAWFAVKVVDVQALQIALLPVILLAAIALVLGTAFFRLAFIPIFILFFAIPVWQPVLPLLQDITTAVTHFNLKLIGRPVFVEGYFVHLPGGSFVIEESCSGLRFLLVSVTLSLINSSLNRHTLRQGMLSLAIIVSLAFLANWVRVLAVILIGDSTNMQSSLVDDHANFGWMVYLMVALVPYILINRLLIRPGASADSTGSGSWGGSTIYSAGDRNRNSSRRITAMFCLACALVLLGPLLERIYGQTENLDRPRMAAPAANLPWQSTGSLNVESAWTPAYDGASERVAAGYVDAEGQAVQVHVAHYGVQNQSAELINADNSLTDGTRWRIVPVSETIVQPGVGDGPENVLSAELQAAGDGRRMKVWYWYNVGGRNTVSPYWAKLFQVTSLLQGRGDASLFALAAECQRSCDGATEALGRFLRDMSPELQNAVSLP